MNNTTNLKPRLKSSKDAAAYLAISERKLWDLSSKNIIPTVRLGRAVRYDQQDLDTFIARAKGVNHEK